MHLRGSNCVIFTSLWAWPLAVTFLSASPFDIIISATSKCSHWRGVVRSILPFSSKCALCRHSMTLAIGQIYLTMEKGHQGPWNLVDFVSFFKYFQFYQVHWTVSWMLLEIKCNSSHLPKIYLNLTKFRSNKLMECQMLAQPLHISIIFLNFCNKWRR